MVKKPNSTNHMRPTTVGAFILQSVGWIRELPPCDLQTFAKALHSMTACKRGHGCDLLRDMGTNSPFERGERCVQCAVVVTRDGCLTRPLEDGLDGCAVLSGRIRNSGASVHAGATAATSNVSSSAPSPINGPTAAT
jgi:hypothetical protein